jgi:uncharacterized membrane protein YagU involved in acid resistance
MEKQKAKSGRWTYALVIGFFAGVIWWGIKIGFYYFKFTKVLPGFLAVPWFTKDFLNSWNGHMVGWVFFIGFSIIAALIYALLFHKLLGPWPGIIYGIAWWVVLYLRIGPLLGMMKWIYWMNWDTIITEISIFILWGVFIGYSVAFEFNDESAREPLKQS